MNRLLFSINSVLFIVLFTQVTTEDKYTDTNTTKQYVVESHPRALSANPKTISLPEIQVNRLPHPLNVNGMLPYQVWVDGERLKLNGPEAKSIIKALDLNFTQPDDTPELHAGAGWLFPLELE